MIENDDLCRPELSWEDFRSYGGLFQPWLDGQAVATESLDMAQAPRWIALTETHGTRASLAWVLSPHDLTREVRTFVELTLLYARAMAEQRRKALVSLAAAFNEIGVVPMLLKGTAGEVGGIFPDPGFRSMGDIDVLVPAEQLVACAKAAEAIGFVTCSEADFGHSHPPQRNLELGLTLDLHRCVTRVYERESLSVATLYADAHEIDLNGTRVLLAKWSNFAILTILHAFTWDRARHIGVVPWKALLDLAALQASDVAVDWGEVRQHFKDDDDQTTLEHAEVLFQALLGKPLAGLKLSPHRANNILRRYRWTEQSPRNIRIKWLITRMRNRIKYLMHEPARARKLFSANFYRGLEKDIRKVFYSRAS